LTFKDLQKLVHSQSNSQQTELFQRLRNKPFWIWDIEDHKREDIKTKGDCCFNHIIGLPTKENKQKPLYDYEKIIFNSLSSSIIIPNNIITTNTGNHNKHLWIKKATGLGITEFMLRYMAWLCLKDDKLKGSQMCIVTGPRIDLAITLIDRLKKLFTDKGLVSTFPNKETIVELNGVRIEAFPSHHLDSMRGLPNVSFILLDEADFFPPGQQQDARDVSERYIGKSSPYIVMVSTPNAPGGLFQNIEQKPDNTCIYKRLFFDYTYGIDKIYTREEIEKAKQSPSFEREYNLKYLGLIGNLFNPDTIERAEQLGLQYPDFENFNESFPKSIAIDPAFASVGSKFGVVVTEKRDDIIRVLYAEEFGKATTEGMLDNIRKIRQRFMIFGDNYRIYVDASNPAFIRSLKLDIGEYVDYENQSQKHEQEKGDIHILEYYMKVVPVSFNKYGRYMLGHMKDLIDREKVAINPNVASSLLTQMKMANVINNDQLDKSIHSLDLVDALRLNLLFYRLDSDSGSSSSSSYN
jgi:hypothetical protein